VNLKSQSKPRKPGQLAFRRPLKSVKSSNPETMKIYADIESRTGVVPEIYRVKALADNPDWLRVLHNSVFQWPRSCVLDEKTKELVGLAKSIAYAWEPGVLTNTEGAIAAGATPNEITEAILIASTIIGLADLDCACRAGHFEVYDDRTQTTIDPSVQRVYDDATSTFGKIPELYRFSLLAGNPDWLKAVHEPAKIRYANGVLGQKTKALICLGASAAKRWDKGVAEHVEFALKSGAQPREIADVLCSIYKTAVSIGVQTGFSVPCSIPEMNGFRLLKDYYSKPNSSAKFRRKKRS
jgi:alkylhydroperoxidase/carboxymuconolactone decarboxylase family protein YurZ